MVSQFKLPILSTFATSEELSDKSRFKYFSRLVPPDSIATEAMAQMMEEFGWTYIQLLYSEGSYGENAAKGVEKNAKKRGICIGYSYRFNADDSNDFDAVAKKIIEHKKAKIITMIAASTHRRKLFIAMDKIAKDEKFIFVVADAFGRTTGYEHIQAGSLQIIYDNGNDAKFWNYVGSLKPSEANHPWERELWESAGKCNYSLDINDQTSCIKFSNLSETGLNFRSNSGLKYPDGIETFAKALDDLIKNDCPSVSMDKSLLKVIDQFFLSFLFDFPFKKQGYYYKIYFISLVKSHLSTFSFFC